MVIARALAHLIVRYTDPDNWMAAEIRSNGSVKLIKCLDGRETNVASNTYTTAATVTVRVKASGTTYTIWVDGTQKISTTDGDLAWGTVALSGRSPSSPTPSITTATARRTPGTAAPAATPRASRR
ncbi:MAG: hypothetical protein IT449_09830 [Phycisphaerales bacterium]|nr:hypothetical protein [Phycisphaerales bacterium]